MGNFTLVVGFYSVFASIIIGLLWLSYRREQRNKEQKEELRTITDTLAEGLYVIDSKGIIQEINSTACETLGYSKEEM